MAMLLSPLHRSVLCLCLLCCVCCYYVAADTGGIEIRGAGSTTPGRVYNDAFFAYRYVQPSVSLSYTQLDSDGGTCRLMSHATACKPSDNTKPFDVDFAGTGTPLSAGNYQQYPDLQMYPTLACAVVPIFNLGVPANLTLTRPVLAQIFNGEIRQWDDYRIVATNPAFAQWGIPANQSIEVVVRSEVADATFILKGALAAFWAPFANVTGVDTSANWPGVNATKVPRYERLNAYVTNTPYTIGYATLGQAKEFHMPMVQIMKTVAPVAPSVDSTTYAVLELGPSFGNNGDNPKHLTAALQNARGVQAWPIVGYTYIALRKDTLRANATCDTVQAMVDFWQWFWTSDVASSMALQRYFVPLPSVIRDYVLAQFLQDIACNGTQVWSPPSLAQISGYGKQSVQQLFTSLAEIYSLSNPQAQVSFKTGKVQTDADISTLLQNYTFVAFNHRKASNVPNARALSFVGVGFVVISAQSLVLDIPTLIQILEGNITTWLHPNIVALNPQGLRSVDGTIVSDPSLPIKLLNGPAGRSDSWQNIMQFWDPRYTGAAIKQAVQYPDEAMLHVAVLGTPYSLAITTYVGDFGSILQLARIKRSDGAVVTPSIQSIRACASHDAFDKSSGIFLMQASTQPTCYPICEAVYLSVHKSDCNNTTDPDRMATIQFIEWLFGGNSDDALEQLNMTPLGTTTEVVLQANGVSLQYLTCNKTAAKIPLGPILGGSIGAFCVLSVVVAIYIYRSTAELRAMRKKISDDNVAQECAQAIAYFDLDAVAWLSTVKNPTRIQQSFLRIISLLTEVKPFIPDQLLVTLSKASGGDAIAAEAEEPSPHVVHNDGDTVCSTPLSIISSGKSSYAYKHSNASGSDTNSEGHPRMRRSNPQAFKAPRRAIYNQSHRACTYMFIRFWMEDSDIDEDTRANLMGTINAYIITLGKAHAATIDHVAFDSVAFHWNVAINAAAAPTQACSMALKLAAANDILPAERQLALRLAIGIGHGICHVSTVSAAGHRFFVVGGRAVSAAVDLVALGLPTKVRCSILITQNVYVEVRYTIECFPRMWFNETLLWEPTRLRDQDGPTDEWMYELKNMDTEDSTHFCGKTLHEVFMMVHTNQPAGAIRQKVRTLKTTHTEVMTPQDTACLDLLIANLAD